METKIWLVEGFCPVDDYHCLMPVEYKGVDNGGVITEYQKNRMVCRHALAGKCEHVDTCSFFKAAPDQMDKDATWHQ